MPINKMYLAFSNTTAEKAGMIMGLLEQSESKLKRRKKDKDTPAAHSAGFRRKKGICGYHSNSFSERLLIYFKCFAVIPAMILFFMRIFPSFFFSLLFMAFFIVRVLFVLSSVQPHNTLSAAHRGGALLLPALQRWGHAPALGRGGGGEGMCGAGVWVLLVVLSLFFSFLKYLKDGNLSRVCVTCRVCFWFVSA
jgi:hypothetical protein